MKEDFWENVGKRWICRKHLVYFDNEKKCPKCYINEKEDVSERRTPLSPIDLKAYDFYKKGHSFSWISKQLKVSKSTAFGYVQKAIRVYKADKGVTLPNDKGFIKGVRTYKGVVDKEKNGVVYKGVRLHNDCISVLIQPIDLSMERDCVKLRFCRYKLVNTVKEHIQIFSNKLVVQFLDDIEGKDEEECFVKANVRIKEFISKFEYKGVRLISDTVQQVSRHYAIIGSDLAKHFIKEKKKVIVLNPDNKGVRARIDFSNRVPELEFENPVFNRSDTNIWDGLIKDSLEEDIDLLSVTKKKIDFLQNDYVKANKNFTEKMNWLAENLASHQRVLEKLERGIDKFNKVRR